MVWELTNEDLYTTNILTFFIIGDLGQPSTKIKDIIHVTDKNNNQLIFTKNNITNQINFIENLQIKLYQMAATEYPDRLNKTTSCAYIGAYITCI